MKSNVNQQANIIGLFDSGLGGLSVLRQLQKLSRLTNSTSPYRFIYLADSARCPYGDRSTQEIKSFVEQIVNWLLTHDVQKIIMACNTSAAHAASIARAISPVPVLDLITPTAQFAASLKVKIGIIATTATAKSRAFSRAIAALNPFAHVTEIACPELVPLIEKGLVNTQQTRIILERYLQELLAQNIRALILGCTHYPFLRPLIDELLPPHIMIIDPAIHLLAELIGFKYTEDQVDVFESPNDSKMIYVTGCPTSFANGAQACLGSDLGSIIGIQVDDLLAAQLQNLRAGADTTASGVFPMTVLPSVADQPGSVSRIS